MASLRLRWSNNGGYVTSSSSSLSSEQHSFLGRRRRNFLPDHKPMTQQRHRFRLSVAVDRTSNPSHLMGSDRSSADWAAISNVFTKKRVIDKEADSKKLDRWMTDSIADIVNNIGEGPLLVHIYSDDDERKDSSSNAGTRLVIEKGVLAESWPIITGRWEGGNATPNGVVLVEELKSKEVADDAEAMDKQQLQDTDRIWGVLIQAKGLNSTACYILKTCRVQSLLGFCTHFCLVRVDCFVESAEIQLMKLWLQR